MWVCLFVVQIVYHKCVYLSIIVYLCFHAHQYIYIYIEKGEKYIEYTIYIYILPHENI